MQDKLKELDLVPFAMSGHTNLMDADRLPDFIMNMRLAHFFGCKYIVSSIGEAHLKDKAKTGNEAGAEHQRTDPASERKWLDAGSGAAR